MKITFLIDGKPTNIQDYYFTKRKKGYVEKITYDDNSNEVRNLELNELEYNLNQLRKKRKLLLDNGFDPWEKAVLRGREADDSTIMLWYQDLKDLKESAFENIPERIRYYLGGGKHE